VNLLDVDSNEVGVRIRQSIGKTQEEQATVVASFSNFDDDIVLLLLVNKSVSLSPEQVAVLGTAELSEGNEFLSFGFRRLGSHPSGRANGQILGYVDPAEGRTVQAYPVELRTRDIRPGMSGAAVLDQERNLVVGVINTRWNPGDSSKDDNIGWAVDARVLTLVPMQLPVRDTPLPLNEVPQPRIETSVVQNEVALEPRVFLEGAPSPLGEDWAGRRDLLQAISADWVDTNTRVTSLVGFGGEGKSSLARQWLDELLEDSSQVQPDGVFWWAFYDKPTADEFFEVALTFVSRGLIDPDEYPSANARAHLIAAMLANGRYLFVLDGLEVIQDQQGDGYGLLKNTDLRDFMHFFAAPGHESFCLITSRAPILDLLEYTTHIQRDIDRLSPVDGRTLLRKLGAKGSDSALDLVVTQWGGHALTLNLFGAYLAERHGGDIGHVDDAPMLSANEPRWVRVHHMLRRYDELLTAAEQAFLMLFSVFREPIGEDALAIVFRSRMEGADLNAPPASLDDASFNEVLQHLLAYRIVRYESDADHYTLHPLIRDYYLQRLAQHDSSQIEAIHRTIAHYYILVSGAPPNNPTLANLAPFIEAVYHSCRGRRYRSALIVYWKYISQGERFALTSKLGAYDVALDLLLEFFPERDASQEPQLDDPGERRGILNRVAYCQKNLGHLFEAAPLFQRSVNIALDMEDWANACRGLQSVVDIFTQIGLLEGGEEVAVAAVDAAYRSQHPSYVSDTCTWLAWVYHLSGRLEAAGELFRHGAALTWEDKPAPYLIGLSGIQYADHLRRVGDTTHAREVTELNKTACEILEAVDDLSRIYRLLGDLEAGTERTSMAGNHYHEAISIARRRTRQDILIEALLSRGTWAGRWGDVNVAYGDLGEALSYAEDGDYQIYEAGIRVGLAWTHIKTGNISAARSEAELARDLSATMSYYWGEADAKEVLAELDFGES
jgi:tetratricopeptide (TPR) repeat protein